jgi:hypothetical protein
VDRVGARPLRRVEHALGDEVGFARWRGPDAVGLVGHADVERAGVGVGKDRHGSDSALAAGTHHPDGDLAAVRYEHFADRSVRQIGGRGFWHGLCD